MKSPLSVCLGVLRYVATVGMRSSRHGTGRLLRAAKFPVNFLLKSFTWDALLLLVPGIMSLATGFRMKTDQNSASYLTVVCHSVTSWPHHVPTALLFCAVTAVFLGVFRFSVISLYSKTAITYYMYITLLLATANLLFGVATVFTGAKLRKELERNFFTQIRDINKDNSPLQLSTGLQEAWDVLQMQLGCCGVNGYKDYSSLPEAKQKKEPLPSSCCAIRWVSEMPQVINAPQCQLDARLGVRDSIYINMPGCLQPLSAWLKHYLHAQVFVMFLTIISQSMALLYSYVIYYRPMTSRGCDTGS